LFPELTKQLFFPLGHYGLPALRANFRGLAEIYRATQRDGTHRSHHTERAKRLQLPNGHRRLCNPPNVLSSR